MKGYTLMHEHVIIDLSKEKQDLDCYLNDKHATIAEFKELYRLGVSRIVDVTNRGMGQDVAYVNEVAAVSNIEILHSAGYYKDPFLPDEVRNMTSAELASKMIHDIKHLPAHMIGEIGTSKNHMTEHEKKVFDATVMAHQATNLPISTHTTLGTFALEQICYFEEKKVNLAKVIIGHMDLSNDEELILQVLQKGVNVGFDTIGKNNYVPDQRRVEMLQSIRQAGRLNQIVLSLDITRKSHLKEYGGIGYCYLFETFLPMLRKSGFTEQDIDTLLIHNPNRILEVNV